MAGRLGTAALHWGEKYGATPDQIYSLSAQIGHIESNNINMEYQKTNFGNRYDLGKGYFQMEVGYDDNGKSRGYQTAVQRYKNLLSEYGMDKNEFPPWVERAKKLNDPSKLPRWQQEELMLADLAMKPNNRKDIDDFLKTGIAKELWVNSWYAGTNKEKKSIQWDKNIVSYKDTFSKNALEIEMKKHEKPLGE